MKTYIDKITEEVARRTNIKNRNLVNLYALLVLTKGEGITLQDVHDAWSMDMNFRPRTDRCYGHDHLSLVPFDALSADVKGKDQKYVEILRNIAREN